MQLLRYNPHKDIIRFERDVDKTLSDLWGLPWPPVFQDPSAVDMYTKGGKLVIEATLPGFSKEEVTINAQPNVVDIKAEHQDSKEDKAGREYLLQERVRSYHRQVVLPDGTSVANAEAEFTDGTLRITMPLNKELETKTLMIK